MTLCLQQQKVSNMTTEQNQALILGQWRAQHLNAALVFWILFFYTVVS